MLILLGFKMYVQETKHNVVYFSIRSYLQIPAITFYNKTPYYSLQPYDNNNHHNIILAQKIVSRLILYINKKSLLFTHIYM